MKFAVIKIMSYSYKISVCALALWLCCLLSLIAKANFDEDVQSIVYSHGDPTNYEQYQLELINAARGNPAGEAARLGIDLNQGLTSGRISTDVKQPLAFHPLLLQTARGHSDWMLNTNTFSHTGISGSTPTERAAGNGYDFGVAENIAYVSTSRNLDLNSSTQNTHDNLFKSSGHRTNLMDPSYSVVGLGLRTGVFSSLNALMVTQNFSSGGDSVDSGPFLLGVVYDDKNENGVYDPGEGLEGVRVEPSYGGYHAITSASGGYAVPLPPNDSYNEDVSVPLAVQTSTWDQVRPYDEAFRLEKISSATVMNVQVVFSGGGLAQPLQAQIEIPQPTRINYKLKGTDGYYYQRTMVSSLNVKHDLNSPKSTIGSFQIIEGSYTWHEAKADAEARGGRLAVLDTQEKLDAVRSLFQATEQSGHLFIGMSDQEQEGEWNWINGNPVLESNWEPGEPNDLGDEDYGMIYFPMATWNDARNDFGAYVSGYLLETSSPDINLDADGDGYADEEELQWDTDPNNSDSYPQVYLNFSSSNGGGYVGVSYNDYYYDSYDGSSGIYVPLRSTLTLTAYADDFYWFSGWSGDASGEDNPLTITMDGDKSVYASFEYDGGPGPWQDSDDDGLSDDDEYSYGTDPYNYDSDYDGLGDGEEVYAHGTSPASSDTDGDGYNDKVESDAGTDPNNALAFPAPPIITSTNSYTGTVGVAFSNTVAATGSTPITFGASNLPTGLSISTNGVITGTPTTAGTNTATLTASNAYGQSAQSVTFEIGASVGYGLNYLRLLAVQAGSDADIDDLVVKDTDRNIVVYSNDFSSADLDDFRTWFEADTPSLSKNLQEGNTNYVRVVNGRLRMESIGYCGGDGLDTYESWAGASLKQKLPENFELSFIFNRLGGWCGHFFVEIYTDPLLTESALSATFSGDWFGGFTSFFPTSINSLESTIYNTAFYTSDTAVKIVKSGAEARMYINNALVATAQLGHVLDSDGDGYADEEELQWGTDPNNSDSYPQVYLSFSSSNGGGYVGVSYNDYYYDSYEGSSGIYVPLRSTLTLTAYADDFYWFNGWSGDASGEDNPLTITMDGDKSVYASFEYDGGPGPWQDSDDDGLSDDDEYNYGTDPYNYDSDYDGLGDGDELYKYGTSPTSSDTDGDGYSDGEEIERGSGPNDSWSKPQVYLSFSSNGGGRINATGIGSYNYWLGWYEDYYQDPYNGYVDLRSTVTLTATPDSGYLFSGWSGDGTGTSNSLSLTMDVEKSVQASFEPDYADDDGDGLTNYDEATLHYTDLNSPDTDSDGYSDGEEVERGSDPNAYWSKPLGSISGLVTDKSGVGLAGISVVAYQYDDDYYYGSWYTSSTTTSENGSYQLHGLNAGKYRIQFSDYSGEYLSEWSTFITISDSEEVGDINAVLAKPSSISGTIRDEEGSPLEGIGVSVYSVYDSESGLEWYSESYATTDVDGSYMVSGLPAGTYRIALDGGWDGDFLPEYYNNALSLETAEDIVLLEEEERVGIDASLTTASRITGVVADQDGSPLEQISVSVYQYDAKDEWWHWVTSAETDELGEYSLGSLAAGIYRVEFRDYYGEYAVECYENAPDLDSAKDIVVAKSTDVSGINATMVKASGISGVVTGPNGQTPLADVEVELERWTGDDWSGQAQISTDGDGSYRFDGLPAGTYRIGFKDGSGQYALEYYNNEVEFDLAENIVLAAEQQVENINASLVLGSRINGKVTGPDGNPLPSVSIDLFRLQANGQWDWYDYCSANADGTYEIGALPNGTYRVGFLDDEEVHAAQFYKNNGNTIYFELARSFVISSPETISGVNGKFDKKAGTIKGKVTDSDGSPSLREVRIEVYRKDDQGTWRVVLFEDFDLDDDGSFGPGMLSAGTYRLKFEKDGYITKFYGDAHSISDAKDIVLGDGQVVDGIHVSLSTEPAPQFITAFASIGNKTYGDAPFAVTPPSASSGLPVVLSVKSGPATISGNTVTLTGAGTVVLAANQVGNAEHAVATEVTTSFTVSKAPQTIAEFAALANKTLGDEPFAVAVPTSTSGLPVTLSVRSGPATISGNTVTINATGIVVLAAKQSGDANYLAASEVIGAFAVMDIKSMAGDFIGNYDLDGAADLQDAYDYNGQLALKVSAGGVFSGSLVIRGSRLGVKGKFDEEGNAKLSIKTKTTSEVVVELLIEPMSNKEYQVAATIAWPDQPNTPFNCYPVAYTGKGGETDFPLAGKQINSLLASQSSSGIDFGHGFVMIKTSKDGALKFTGRAADGSAITGTTRLVKDAFGDVIAPVSFPLSAVKGLLHGVAEINSNPGEGQYHFASPFEWTWLRLPQTKAKTYKEGFAEKLGVYGQVWSFTKGQSALPEAEGGFTFQVDPEAVLLEEPLDLSGTWPSSNKSVWDGAPKGFTFKVNTATGQISGSAPRTIDGKATKALKYEGLLVRPALESYDGAPLMGGGYLQGTESSAVVELTTP